MDKAHIMYRDGQYQNCIRNLQIAIELDPRSVEAYFLLGNALSHLGNRELALAAFRSAEILAPQIAEIHANLGNAYLALGEFVAAVAEYTIALKLNPDDRVARHNISTARKLAESLFKSQDTEIIVVDVNRDGSVDKDKAKKFHATEQQIEQWIIETVPSNFEIWRGYLDELKKSQKYVFHGYFPLFSFGEAPPRLVVSLPRRIFWSLLLRLQKSKLTKILFARFWLGPDGVQRHYVLIDDNRRFAIPLMFVVPRWQEDLLRGTSCGSLILHPWVTEPRDISDWQSQPLSRVSIGISIHFDFKASSHKLCLFVGQGNTCFNCLGHLETGREKLFVYVNNTIPVFACEECHQKCQTIDWTQLTSTILSFVNQFHGLEAIQETKTGEKILITPQW